jgi:hypothetical protein
MNANTVIAEYVVTEAHSLALADMINDAFRADANTTVNGLPLVSRFGRPVARSYQNGTVGIVVPARTVKGKTNDVFVKVGQALTIGVRA